MNTKRSPKASFVAVFYYIYYTFFFSFDLWQCWLCLYWSSCWMMQWSELTVYVEQSCERLVSCLYIWAITCFGLRPVSRRREEISGTEMWWNTYNIQLSMCIYYMVRDCNHCNMEAVDVFHCLQKYILCLRTCQRSIVAELFQKCNPRIVVLIIFKVSIL